MIFFRVIGGFQPEPFSHLKFTDNFDQTELNYGFICVIPGGICTLSI